MPVFIPLYPGLSCSGEIRPIALPYYAHVLSKSEVFSGTSPQK
jgi:hypothetical protein